MNTTATQARRFLVRGINDDESSCMCCGRQGLKRVVWIEDTETGEIRHYGVVCATAPAKAFGLTGDIKRAIREHDKAQEEAARIARNEALRIETDTKLARRDALYLERGGTYVEKVSKINGYKFTCPADAAWMDACHREVFPAQYSRQLLTSTPARSVSTNAG